ncbi:glycosyl transferase [Frankia sp. CNm7]|uniref:Glycosyl transferase n=1 Tax=Frankia nepalensis TaxID=1836974 RepID=A0A937R8S7_9ACTN|nr:nucleotide disphospho-sugar-binding domain-containing protein [Frankia nepalensis]MBL7495429.1 glycosyl transferase [Frankia nepalensis]MBL7510741.1 glycosyl transferase [Frankia nepalensis]MBL7522668.1 glycosyl transferase [Frankia nepalensis]MBL7625985.1 glycosyl transferase [Frankia nepalensis]
MARFLFATVPAVGHTLPALPIARALLERGHAVRWYGGVAFADKITAVGASFHPITDPDFDYSLNGLDQHYPRRRELSGLKKLQFDMVQGFSKPVPTQVRDLRALLRDEPADAVIADTGFIGGVLLRELGGPPLAGFGVSILPFTNRHLAPLGMGLAPANGPLGRLRNRALAGSIRRVLLRPVTAELNQTRRGLGLPESSAAIFDYPLATQLYLQFSARGFEYDVPDVPSQVAFVGPPRQLDDPGWQAPAWWPELSGRRVVLVNQGTVATDADQLIRPALAGLAGEDVLVVAVTGGADPAGLAPLPANARVERYIPFDRLLPHVDVFVTNGGYGGVQLALAHGVPIVGAGRTEDKIEVNARVAAAGVGVNLRTQTPEPDQIRAAVATVLTDSQYAWAARRMRDEIAKAGRESRAADLLEQLAGGAATPVPAGTGAVRFG